MSIGFFGDLQLILYVGLDSCDLLIYWYYNKDEIVFGKWMEDYLCFVVCYWYSFCWLGFDLFGGEIFNCIWMVVGGDLMEQVKLKVDVVFEMFQIFGMLFFIFYDCDIVLEGKMLVESNVNVNVIVDIFEKKMVEMGIKFFWGMVNMFFNCCFMVGVVINFNLDVFVYVVVQVKNVMDVIYCFGGFNYVFWGGCEGYEILFNINVCQEFDQFGWFFNMVVEYKYKIGFDGVILIELKLQEFFKYQYDYDVVIVYGFLKVYGLENEVKMNIEQGYVILVGYFFEYELYMV